MNDKNIQKVNYSHKISLFNVIKFGLTLVARTMLVFFVVFNIVGVLHGVSYGFTTFFTQHFYDSIAGVINGIESIRMIYTMVVLLGLTFIVREILNGLDNFIRFINLPERRSTNDVLDCKKGIIANKISFTYPHANIKVRQVIKTA